MTAFRDDRDATIARLEGELDAERREAARLRLELTRMSTTVTELRAMKRRPPFPVWNAVLALLSVAVIGTLTWVVVSSLRASDTYTRCRIEPVPGGFQLKGVLDWEEDSLLGYFEDSTAAAAAAERMGCPLR